MTGPIDVLKNSGIRVTPQRVAVFELLSKPQTEHLSMEEIYDKVKKRFPAVSLATVYSIIETLRQKDLVRELRIRADKALFESRTDNHHHFFCNKCNAVFDVDFEPCECFKHMQINGHSIEKVQGYFYGTCEQCISKGAQ